MPPFGSTSTEAQGHSFAMWISQPDLGASFSHTWLACTPAVNDLSDGIILSYSATSGSASHHQSVWQPHGISRAKG